MRAYRFDDFKSLDGLRLHEEEMPRQQRGEILVRVRAVSLNYRDLAMVLGRYVSDTKTGLIPTSDATGEIVAVGEGVNGYKVDDRVMGAFHSRWFGGEVLVAPRLNRGSLSRIVGHRKNTRMSSVLILRGSWVTGST